VAAADADADNEDADSLDELPSIDPTQIAVLSCLCSGRRIVYLEAFDAESWLEAVELERITQAMVVPTMLDRVLRLAEARGSALATLRHLSYGGGRMPLELIERALTQLPLVNFVNAYERTETSSTVAILAPDDHRELLALATRPPAPA
jgi:acyl-CoA synthetase (AMP-forming)/AMP-acid ligase II